MDFAFSEMQNDIRGLAKQMLADLVTKESLDAIDRDGGWMHEAAWKALARSDLLAMSLPEAVGGGGMGLTELCLLLQQVGRTAAPLPVLQTLVMGALPIARFGDDDQKARHLAGVAAGERLLTAALSDVGGPDPAAPLCRAERDGDGWRLHGQKTAVPIAELAATIVVPAQTEEGVTVFLLDPSAEGVGIEAQRGTSGEPLGLLTLDGAVVADVDVLGAVGHGAEIVDWLVERVTLGQCALMLGLCEQALFMTAAYSGQREQFGVPIGTFQAVSQRCGDAYIDILAIKVALWQAMWRLDTERPAERALAIAKFWACDGGHRVVAAAQHIHGGMGFDRDYPLYRFFLSFKQVEFSLGGATSQLARLGAVLAAPN